MYTENDLARAEFVVFDADSYALWERWRFEVDFEEPYVAWGFKYYEFGLDYPCWGYLGVRKIGDILTCFANKTGAYKSSFDFEKFVEETTGLKLDGGNNCDMSNFFRHPALQKLTLEDRWVAQLRRLDYESEEAKRIRKQIERQ